MKGQQETLARRNPLSDAVLEVRSYLEESLIRRTADPLSFSLPTTCQGDGIVATSVPSEGIFPKTGQITTERRNWISPSKMRHLVSLAFLMAICPKQSYSVSLLKMVWCCCFAHCHLFIYLLCGTPCSVLCVICLEWFEFGIVYCLFHIFFKYK